MVRNGQPLPDYELGKILCSLQSLGTFQNGDIIEETCIYTTLEKLNTTKQIVCTEKQSNEAGSEYCPKITVKGKFANR